ncbi:peptidoglycan-binding protein [Streptomyces sp. CA-111067]|uniref:peptidoglycan-binding domain-containing protein n=1 Tax=Streptomyces sp. CA-111067 TaxID=3240046 RepID=UPI003D967D21
MGDGAAAGRTADDGREEAPSPGGTATVAARQAPGGEPPDVIEVVFPAAGPPGSRPAVADARVLSGRADSGRRRMGEQPLLLGALAIATVGLATALAWQLWPQSPSAEPVGRPGPVVVVTSGGGPTGSGAPPSAKAAPAASNGPTAPPRSHPERGTVPSAPAGQGGTTTAPGRGPLVPVGGSPSASATADVSPTATRTTGSPVETTTPAVPPAPRTLSAGDTGPDVTQLQVLLFSQGFTYVSQTGVYDEPTVRGVTQAQQDRGLTCDPPGVYGPCTRAALSPS